ncbi:hypothetical protein [Ensifer aridi]|uniref:hypothetical protein n=1 Tax=Ensifer aridi TaxID=1708715 RepID=UPI00358F56E9
MISKQSQPGQQHRVEDARPRMLLKILVASVARMLKDHSVKSTGTWSDDTTVSSAALERGVVVMPLSRMNVASTDKSRLLLGFSALSEQEADMGTRLLAEVFRNKEFVDS